MKTYRFAAIGLLFSTVALAQTAPGAIERGMNSYQKNMCYACHGTVGQGGERNAGPKIAPNAWPYAAFAQQVRHPRATMPRYTARFLQDAELSDLYAYVASIKVGAPASGIPLLADLP